MTTRDRRTGNETIDHVIDERVLLEDDTGPYLRTVILQTINRLQFNQKFEDSNPPKCKCGHDYYRHFDGYENSSPVGCKYCGCDTYELPEE